MPPVQLPDTIVESGTDNKIEEIPPYNVIFLNDNVTTMDFVVQVLVMVFKKDTITAVGLMLEIHQSDSAIVAVLGQEEAELRQQQTHTPAQNAGFPLRYVVVTFPHPDSTF